MPLKANHIVDEPHKIGPKEGQRYKLLLLFAAAVVVVFVIVVLHSTADTDESDEMFKFTKPSDKELEKVKESYKKQEINLEKDGSKLDNIDDIKANNSGLLPPRRFSGTTAEQMCQSGMAGCVQRFARIQPLIVVTIYLTL
ncbi:unnamed protein product [Strongylus vulgaris]|uniref:Uncharacterized protein n=1 Tax=Strongylus vulgaris TaxID=40348 RepID=A0A3P7LSW2_STRVU|nr:unnamed protein product [Strongylus vulgaris]